MSALLEVEDLGTWFYTRQGIVKAVDGVDFHVASGETLAIVGESGCGKSMTALSLMRLIPDPPGRIVSGSVKLGGRDLLQISEEEMRRVRGNEISMIFQEPMTSLNPVMTIGKQIAEALILHRDMDRKAALQARHRDARPGAHPRAGAARQGISAPALGRHAPARHDRHGAGLQSQGADRRRADHGARRHHPGADPRADRRTAARVQRRGDPDHPRSRRRRRDGAAGHRHVCRPQGRGGRGRRAVRAAAASLHGGPAGLDPAARPDARPGRAQHRPPAGDPGHRAAAVRPARGLRLRPALQQGRRSLPPRAAGLRAEDGQATGRPAGIERNGA